jgi:hypothetical protein
MAKATPLSLAELNQLTQRLQATLELLVGKGAARGGLKNGGGGGRKRSARGSGKALQQKLHDTLKGAKNGLSLGELAGKVGGSKETIGYHLRVLRDGKRAKVVGNRGTARWHSA